MVKASHTTFCIWLLTISRMDCCALVNHRQTVEEKLTFKKKCIFISLSSSGYCLYRLSVECYSILGMGNAFMLSLFVALTLLFLSVLCNPIRSKSAIYLCAFHHVLPIKGNRMALFEKLYILWESWQCQSWKSVQRSFSVLNYKLSIPSVLIIIIMLREDVGLGCAF